MKRSQRIAPALHIAKREERAAAQALSQARTAMVDEQQRLGDLQSYYTEYDMLFKRQTQGLRANDLASQREFMTQLAQSCNVQQRQIDHVTDLYHQAKGIWHQCYLKHENLLAFVKKISREESTQEDKQEQGRIDEWVTQNHLRR